MGVVRASLLRTRRFAVMVSIVKPCYLGSAFRAAALNEYAAVTHAQRVAGRELRRAAVMAERVGEQQLADMLGGLPPLPQRLDLRDALAAAELPSLRRRT